MPTVMKVSGFRFFFYSLEGAEPPHIHVEREQCTRSSSPARAAFDPTS